MKPLALYTILLFLPVLGYGQFPFLPDTVQFTKVSGPEFAEVFKNDLLFDKNGVLWVATNKGLFAYDGYDWKSGLSQSNDPMISIDQKLESVQEDSTGAIWFGAHLGGAHRLDPTSGELKAFPAAGYTGEPIHDILCHELLKSGELLVVQTHRGFIRLNPYTEEFLDVHIPFPERNSGAILGYSGSDPSNWIHHYTPDNSDTNLIWLATRHGVVEYHLNGKPPVQFDWPFDNPQRPPGDPIMAIDIHQSGDSLLIGTYGAGFVTYQKDRSAWRNDLIEPYTTVHPEGVWANVIQQIYPVDDTLIMFASSSVSGVYNWSSGKYSFFNIPEDNFPAGIFRNILIDYNGCVWTNNWSGIYRSVSPLFPSKREPQLLVTKCSFSDGVRLKGYLDGTSSEFELLEHQNTVEITYALANPVMADRVRYAHRLEGFDHDWVEAGSRRFVRYANLGGGRYHFSVRATDQEGIQYEKTLLRFDIRLPFYKEPWFISTIALIGMALLIFFYRMHISKIRMKESLKSEFDVKLSNLEMQALRSQMNPHFIFNSLNSIKNYVVNKGPDEASDYLTKFSQLIRVILENSKSDLLSLEQEVRALQLYLEIENLRFNNKFDFELQIDPELNQQNFKLPPMLIQPHVENAIWHGLMHKEGKRSLHIKFLQVDTGLLCVVEDNGIGRAKANELSRSRKHKKLSLGTKITSDRIAMINKLYQTRVVTETEDLLDDEGTALGTRVKIFIENMNNK